MENGITDIETDVYANIPSDHFPMIINFRFKLKGIHRFSKTRDKYAECTKEQREALNEDIKYMINNSKEEITYDELTDILNTAKEKHMPTIYAKGNNKGISEIIMELIKERENQIIHEQFNEARETYKKYKKQENR